MFRRVTITSFGGRLTVPESIAMNDNIVVLKRRDGPKTCELGVDWSLAFPHYQSRPVHQSEALRHQRLFGRDRDTRKTKQAHKWKVSQPAKLSSRQSETNQLAGWASQLILFHASEAPHNEVKCLLCERTITGTSEAHKAGMWGFPFPAPFADDGCRSSLSWRRQLEKAVSEGGMWPWLQHYNGEDSRPSNKWAFVLRDSLT